MKHLGDMISSFVGGGLAVVLATPTDKAMEVVVMALIGGVIGAFAKGAGASLWEFTNNKLKRKKKG